MVFDVNAPLNYYVVAEGVRSTVFKLTVVDVPYVQRLDLEYHYPAYTGLEPEKIEDGGDIAVLRGTEVRVHITPTMKTQSGRIALNDNLLNRSSTESIETFANGASGAGDQHILGIGRAQ